MVKKPAEPITLSSEEGEALMAQGHQSNLPAAVASKLEQIVRLYFWLVFALQEATLSVKRLRTILFGSNAQSKERPDAETQATTSAAPEPCAGGAALASVAEGAPGFEAAGCAPGAEASPDQGVPKAKGGHRVDPGRLGADAYVSAER